MREEFKPAIAALQTDLASLERKVAETKRAINRLCELAGSSAMYDNVEGESRPSVTSIRSDQFYGKALMTASREYLDLRKSANLGPGSPREIYEALVQGGFKFDSKSDVNAMTVLRQVLRKNSAVFHKLPHGAYGLMAWYPNAKPAKHDDDAEQEMTRKPVKAKSTRGAQQASKNATRKTRSAANGKDESLAPRILQSLSDGKDWTMPDLKQAALLWGIDGLTEEAAGRKLQGTLLSLLKKGLVAAPGNGIWRTSKLEAA